MNESRRIETAAGASGGVPAARATPPRSDANDDLAWTGELAVLLGDTRACMLFSGSLLGAALIEMTIVLAARPLSRLTGAAGLYCGCLLAVVMISWLWAAALVALAEVPAARALGELRRKSGAPVDLSVPWVTFGHRLMTVSELGPEDMLVLIGAVTRRHARACLAARWAIAAATGFFAWSALFLTV